MCFWFWKCVWWKVESGYVCYVVVLCFCVGLGVVFVIGGLVGVLVLLFSCLVFISVKV